MIRQKVKIENPQTASAERVNEFETGGGIV
jgi:hypothetical protein